MIATKNEKENIEKLVNEPQPDSCESNRTKHEMNTNLTNTHAYELKKPCKDSCQNYIELNEKPYCIVFTKTEEVKPLFSSWFWNVMDSYKTSI